MERSGAATVVTLGTLGTLCTLGTMSFVEFAMASIWTRILHASADAIFPPRCRVCGAFFAPPGDRQRVKGRPAGDESMAGLVETVFSGQLCPECRLGIVPVRSPVCSRCGLPLAGRSGDDHLCQDCLDGPADFVRARAACVCEGVVLALLHRFKYGGCVDLAGPLAALLQAAFRRHFSGGGIDAIVPVPLHAKRLRSRGFNQAELMVRRWQALHPRGQADGILLPGALIRRRHTPAQAGLGRKERMVNLRGAFSAGPKDEVCGMRVLLVDDVYTTGATVGECARVLAGAGAIRIEVLTLARAL